MSCSASSARVTVSFDTYGDTAVQLASLQMGRGSVADLVNDTFHCVIIVILPLGPFLCVLFAS